MRESEERRGAEVLEDLWEEMQAGLDRIAAALNEEAQRRWDEQRAEWEVRRADRHED